MKVLSNKCNFTVLKTLQRRSWLGCCGIPAASHFAQSFGASQALMNGFSRCAFHSSSSSSSFVCPLPTFLSFASHELTLLHRIRFFGWTTRESKKMTGCKSSPSLKRGSCPLFFLLACSDSSQQPARSGWWDSSLRFAVVAVRSHADVPSVLESEYSVQQTLL